MNSEAAAQVLNNLLAMAKPAVETHVLPSDEEIKANEIAQFPVGDRIQDIIIRLALKGTLPKEIARDVGMTELQVNKILNSEWAVDELMRIARDEKRDGAEVDSIVKLLRIHAFQAIMVTAQIVADKKVSVQNRLAAAKTILFYTIPPAQAKNLKAPSDNRDFKSEQEEFAALQSSVDRLKQQLSKPI